MKKFFKILLIVLVVFIFISTFVFLYVKSRPKEVVYELVTPKVADIVKSTVATGKIEPRDEILIKPQISGIVETVYKQAGEMVKKGEVIAKVKVIPEMVQLNSAESRVRVADINYKQALQEYERQKKLFNDKLISKEEFEKSEVSMKTSKEELTASRDNLDIVKEGISKSSASYSNTLIRSTIDGLILDVPVKKGNSVIMSNTFNDGTTIASVANMNDILFKGKIDETEVGRIKEGMPIKLTIGALQNMKFDANLEYISPKGVTENGANLFEIKAAVKVPAGVKIRAGYSANAEIVLSRSPKVLSIPESTVEFSGDTTFVQVLKSDKPKQMFEKRRVVVGVSDGIKIEVKSGITTKDKVRGAIVEEKKPGTEASK
ncbi:efflux RND transporter periplasmic adaptor subunit [Bacteroides sedimenti]|uniref:efflux RND transporter periplasmic adaptor subunit n=1 Tax=Bacteroides sedimenti TaxID=2136147 RepID=UPI00333FF483